jgi:FkbM family methyltransferase
MSFFKNDTIISRSLQEYGEWAEAEVEFLGSLISPDDTVLDIGAFIGTHTLAFAQKVGGSGRVYAFEPQHTVFAVLKRNVEENGLSNVTLLEAAVSDTVGQMEIREIDVGEAHNFGCASVLDAGAGEGKQAARRTIAVTTVDELAVGRCDLIKIDVENMEIRVLRGARRTLRAAHPIVFAECNSLEYGWPIVEFSREQHYETYLLSTLAYRADNFRRRQSNFFGDGREVGLVLVPAERRALIERYLDPAHYPSLIPIVSIDDLALALLKKPQYKYEVMSNTRAALSIGVDFWANEPETRYLREILAQRTEEVTKLGQVLAQRTEELTRANQARTALRGTIVQMEEAVQELQSKSTLLNQIYNSRGWRALSAYHRLRDRLLPEGSWRRAGVKRAFRIALKAGRMIARRPRTQTQVTNDAQEERPAGAPKAPATGPLYSVDSLKIRGRNLYGFGWLFHQDRQVSGVRLVVRAGRETHSLDTCYGTDRQDVVRNYDCANARSCGFWVTGKLPFEDPSNLALEVHYRNGGVQVVRVPPLGNETRLVGVRITRRRLESGARALLRGEFGSVLRRIREERASQGARQRRFEDVLRLLGEQPASGGPSPSSQAESNSKGLAQIGQFLDAAKESQLSERKFVLVIDHNLGGGANQYRHELVRKVVQQDRPVLLLYYDLPELNYVIAYVDDGSEIRFTLDSPASLPQMSGKIGLGEIFLNNVYSFHDPLNMVRALLALKRASGATLNIAIHDFLPVCPSLHLLDESGRFCGVPALSRCEECLPNHRGEFSFFVPHKDIRSWRETWGDCLAEAASILCFSESSFQLLRRAYPDIDANEYAVRPHVVDYLPARKPRIPYEAPLNIGVVGFINIYKGAGIVRELADCIAQRGLSAKITIIGTMDRRPVHDFVAVTGPYHPVDLPDLIEKSGVNVFLLPSIVPETFSYVAEELMTLDVPLAVFDLGAPAERVAKYGKGLVIAEIEAAKTLDALVAFHARFRREREQEKGQPQDTHQEKRLRAAGESRA